VSEDRRRGRSVETACAPTSPVFNVPRYSEDDPAAFAYQVNAITDTMDAAIPAHPVVHQPGDLIVSAAATRAGCLLCNGRVRTSPTMRTCQRSRARPRQRGGHAVGRCGRRSHGLRRSDAYVGRGELQVSADDDRRRQQESGSVGRPLATSTPSAARRTQPGSGAVRTTTCRRSARSTSLSSSNRRERREGRALAALVLSGRGYVTAPRPSRDRAIGV
jgi:hypothetical protein